MPTAREAALIALPSALLSLRATASLTAFSARSAARTALMKGAERPRSARVIFFSETATTESARCDLPSSCGPLRLALVASAASAAEPPTTGVDAGAAASAAAGTAPISARSETDSIS